MKKTLLVLSALTVALVASVASQGARSADAARWERRHRTSPSSATTGASRTCYGKTDADAVFGAIYAQAEDDFNRVETNYMTQLGRVAEAEGEARIYNDLRYKLFNDADELKAAYASSPAWLQSLMTAWADGLNYYLAKHPAVKPRAITQFEPWMALSFTEGSIGGDIERISVPQLQAFYGKTPASQLPAEPPQLDEPGGSNGAAIAPSNTTSHHALLLINPHTSFYFRSELQMVSDEGLNAYGASTWGQFFLYQGFNDKVGWMHTSSAVDNTDEFLETVTPKGNGYVYKYGAEERPVASRTITVPYKTATRHGPEDVHGLQHASRSHRARTERQVGRLRDDERAGQGAHAVLLAHEGEGLQVVRAIDGAAHELVEQHHLRVGRRRHRVLPRQLHPEARRGVRLSAAGRRQRPRDRLEGAVVLQRDAEPAQSGERLAVQLEQLAVVRGRTEQSEAGGFSEVRRQRHGVGARPARGPRPREQEGLHPRFAPRGRIRQLSHLVRETDAGAHQSVGLTAPGRSLKAKTAEQIAMLRPWDLRWGVKSIATSLAVFWGEEMQRSGGRRGGGAGPENAPADQMLQALVTASDRLTRDFGTWRTPWGDINRFQRLHDDITSHFDDAGASIPVGFTAATWGSLASFSARAYPEHEEMVRLERQQLRRRRRVRTENPRACRHRRRRERRHDVTAFQRPGRTVRHGKSARGVLLQGPAQGTHAADVSSGTVTGTSNFEKNFASSSEKGASDPIGAGVLDLQPLFPGSTGESGIVGNKRVRIVAERKRGRQVQGVERAKVRVAERCRTRDDRIVEPKQDQAGQHGVGPRANRARRAGPPQRTVQFDPSQFARHAIRGLVEGGKQRVGLPLRHDELHDR